MVAEVVVTVWRPAVGRPIGPADVRSPLTFKAPPGSLVLDWFPVATESVLPDNLKVSRRGEFFDVTWGMLDPKMAIKFAVLLSTAARSNQLEVVSEVGPNVTVRENQLTAPQLAVLILELILGLGLSAWALTTYARRKYAAAETKAGGPLTEQARSSYLPMLPFMALTILLLGGRVAVTNAPIFVLIESQPLSAASATGL